jgi:hypothetical protein
MFIDKGLNVSCPGSPRHDDLNPTAWKDFDGKAPGAFAFAHRKARRFAGLFGV